MLGVAMVWVFFPLCTLDCLFLFGTLNDRTHSIVRLALQLFFTCYESSIKTLSTSIALERENVCLSIKKNYF